MRPASAARPLLVAALLACIVIVGVALRLKGPLQTEALGAEDPYTHVVFTKEWLAQGYFSDSFHLGTGMYPPGMHAFMGAFAPLAGLSLYEFARFAPAIFGALGILGMYALASRLGGQTAGMVAALLMAVTPELIFRTELLFPTALDLALLPFWLLAFHLAVTTERRVGSILFVATSVPLAVMHPWLVPLFAAPLALYAVLQWRRSSAPAKDLRLTAALLVAPVAFAMAFRWDDSDTGFADFAAKVPGLQWLEAISLPGPALFVILLAILGALALGAVALATVLPRRRVPVVLATVVGAALAALAFPLSWSLPFEVHYVNMLGWLTIGLALAGYVLAFARPTPLGDLAACITTVLLPLTAFDLFGSPFWPQRTVAYMAVGAVLLGANTAAHVATAISALGARQATSSPGRSAAAGTIALMLVTLAVAGGAVATHEPTYEWYRLYNEEHWNGFERIADIVDDDPSARVVIYTWQPALMVKTLIDPAHVWYSPDFFKDAGERGEVVVNIEGPAYVLVDKNTIKAAESGKASLGFLKDGSRYKEVYESSDGRLVLYEVVG